MAPNRSEADPLSLVIALFSKENEWSTLLGWVDRYGHKLIPANPWFAWVSGSASFFMMLLLLAGDFPWQINLLIALTFGGFGSLLFVAALGTTRIHRQVNTELEAFLSKRLLDQLPAGGKTLNEGSTN